jgi:hypothetical protein
MKELEARLEHRFSSFLPFILNLATRIFHGGWFLLAETNHRGKSGEKSEWKVLLRFVSTSRNKNKLGSRTSVGVRRQARKNSHVLDFGGLRVASRR